MRRKKKKKRKRRTTPRAHMSALDPLCSFLRMSSGAAYCCVPGKSFNKGSLASKDMLASATQKDEKEGGEKEPEGDDGDGNGRRGA